MAPKNIKQLKDMPSYKQKLQFASEFKKTQEREKIKPKEIFETKKKKVVKRNK